MSLRSLLLPLFLFMALSPHAAWSSNSISLVRCDAAQQPSDFRSCILQTISSPYIGLAPGGMYCGLGLTRELSACFLVQYDAEHGQYQAFQVSTPNQIPGTLKNLSESFRADPLGFTQSKSYSADVDVLANGPHDPVRIATEGAQSSDRGRFEMAVNMCLSSFVCVTRIDPALARRMAERLRDTGFGGTIGPIGLSYTWNYFAAEISGPAGLSFCKESNCALVVFRDLHWQFKETRARNGNGARYHSPEYGDSASWSFDDSRDIWGGMRRAGYDVIDFRANHRLSCGWVNGQLDLCIWVSSP